MALYVRFLEHLSVLCLRFLKKKLKKDSLIMMQYRTQRCKPEKGRQAEVPLK